MNIFKATTSFEARLRTRISVVEADLKKKHELMAEDEVRFFRGTFYRWTQGNGTGCIQRLEGMASAENVVFAFRMIDSRYGD